jgi:putative peptidoglycan lipid II flippase
MKNRLRILFQGIGGAALIVLITQILSKGTGFLREILFAGEFGVGKDFEFYLIAFTVPGMINSILFYQAQNYFIPTYNNLKENKPEEGHTFLVSSLIFFLVVISGLAVILYFSAERIVSLFVSSPTDSELQFVIKLFRTTLLTLPLNALISVFSAYLVAEFKFKVTYLSQLWTNLAVIITVIFFSKSLGTLSIVIGFIIGNALQLANLLYGGRKVLPRLSRFKLKLSGNVPYLIFFNTLFIETAGQMFFLIDRLFYSSVDQGGIAALNYSFIIYMLPVSVFTTALGSALLPDFASNIAKGDFREANSKFTKAIELVLLLFIPGVLILIISGGDLISLMFERGKFSAHSTDLTQGTLFYYSFSLPFYALYAITQRYTYSLRGSTFLTIISFLGLALKYLMSYFMVDSMGQNGLALATSVVFILQSISCFVFIKIRADYRSEKGVKQNTLKFILYSTLLTGGALLIISQFNLTTLILPICLILGYPLILHLTRNSVYEELKTRLLGSR